MQFLPTSLKLVDENSIESPEYTSWSDWTNTRKSVWAQERQRNNGHDLYSKATSKKCQGQNVDFYMTYVDLTKALGTVLGNIGKV